MPVFVNDMTTEVTSGGSGIVLDEEQMELILEKVFQELERRERDRELSTEATTIKQSAAPRWGGQE